jgi:hypothetical protein
VRIGCHRDVDPSSGGTTHYDFDAASGAHLFTWRAVPDRLFVLGANTFQIACFANGDVELRFGAMSQAPGYAFPMLVGFTPGHGALDPGSTDLSAQLPLQPPLATFPVDQRPLGLVASGLPELGTTIGLQATNPTATSFGAVFVGVDALFPVSPVGADLGAIGAPGCVLNIDLAPSVSALIGNGPGGSLTMPLSIPNVPALVGARFYAQAAWIDPLRQNAAFGTVGLLTSNALRLTIG